MLLSIAIPTYNRCDMLMKNITELSEIITNNHLNDIVEIMISDNCSSDSTLSCIESVAAIYPSVSMNIMTNTENTGLTKNVLKVLDNSSGEYIMFLGDDDYISEEYLCRVLVLIQEGYGCIIPSYKNITVDGKDTGRGRDLSKKSRSYKEGFINCFINSWRGHQLSGIVMLRAGLYDLCRQNEIQNLYPQIFMVTYCCLHYRTYHLTDFPVLVTRPPQRNKNWGYGGDGLLNDVFDNYSKTEINSLQRSLLELKFLYAQYWRCAMYLKKGPIAFFRCLHLLIKSDKITWFNRIMLILEIPVIFFCQFVSLVSTGKLYKTLRVNVDV